MTEDEFFDWFDRNYYSTKRLVGRKIKCIKSAYESITGKEYLTEGQFYEVLLVEKHNKPTWNPLTLDYTDYYYGYLINVKNNKHASWDMPLPLEHFEWNIDEMRIEKINNILQ